MIVTTFLKIAMLHAVLDLQKILKTFVAFPSVPGFVSKHFENDPSER